MRGQTMSARTVARLTLFITFLAWAAVPFVGTPPPWWYPAAMVAFGIAGVAVSVELLYGADYRAMRGTGLKRRHAVHALADRFVLDLRRAWVRRR